MSTRRIRHLIPISGKDSLCTAIVQMEREPKLPYEFLFCDVGLELPETYEWLDMVERKMKIKLIRIGRSLANLIAEYGKLPSHVYRFCTLQAKIVPYQNYIEKDETTDSVVNYIGFRYDERERIPPSGVERLADARGNVKVKDVYPLIEEKIEIGDVYRILEGKGVMPPDFFWKRLYDAVYDLSGPSSQKWLDEVPAWTRQYLFSWRTRSNCSCCYYQRLFEWVGLLEHHPKLFAQAEEMERVYGSPKSEYRIEKYGSSFEDRGAEYTFYRGFPLRHVRAEAGRIFDKRVRDVLEEVIQKRQRPVKELDLLTTSSCGAYCGK